MPQSSGRGFTLLEMAVAIAILGVIVIFVVVLVPPLTDRMRLDTADVELGGTDEAIVGFVAANNRLPCPDVDGDGVEGAGGTCTPDKVGLVPYRSLGLPGPVLDQAQLPLRYGVYRNAGAMADLATLENLFEPTLPGALTIEPGTVLSCSDVTAGTIQISYSNPSEHILMLTPTAGTFSVGDTLSGSTIDFNMVTPGTLPPPEPLPPPPSCPTGCTFIAGAMPPPDKCECSSFLVGELIYLMGNAPADPPNAEVFAVSGSTLDVPFPTQEVFPLPNPLPNPLVLTPPRMFEVGDTIVGSISGTTAKITAFNQPDTAQIAEIQSAGKFLVNVPSCPPDSPFTSGLKLYGSPQGPNPPVNPPPPLPSPLPQGNFVSLQCNQQALFVAGETVTGQSSSASGTIVSDNGSSMILSGVSGTFGPASTTTPPASPGDPPTTTPGEVIIGGTSGADATVNSIAEGGQGAPNTIPGTLTIPSPNLTASNEKNKLDWCKNLRNAEGVVPDIAEEIHTVDGAIVVNPAYLLVSGGVEDAIPGDIAFDGLNEDVGALDFEAPGRGRDAIYDDVMHATPMEVLDEHASCARNMAAVNALAVSAMVAQNIAISAFNNNENAISAIGEAWAAVKLAQVNVALEAVNTALALAECARATVAAFKVPGAGAAAAVIACAVAVVQIVNFAFAIDSLLSAESSYDSTCEDQPTAAAELTQAAMAATAALLLAETADQKGCVE